MNHLHQPVLVGIGPISVTPNVIATERCRQLSAANTAVWRSTIDREKANYKARQRLEHVSQSNKN